MRYDTILFDADGTLFDFDRAEETAFRLLLEKYSIPYSSGTYDIYRRINREKWRQLEEGTITKDRLVRERFSEFFREIGATEADPAVCNAFYLDALADSSHLLDGAFEVCQELARTHTLAIVTNGVERTQMRRINASPILPFIKDIFVSERVGAAKPDTAYFDYVFAAMGLTDKKRVIIVGDSPGSDILGGNRYGIDTCYYSPSGQAPEGDIRATYTISNLRELIPILTE